MSATTDQDRLHGTAGSPAEVRWRHLVAPGDYRNPEPKPRYHLVVIGAGPAGLVTAIVARGLGARVALVERAAMGGDCLNVGCVPSKALLEITRDGVSGFDAAFTRMRETRAAIAEHDSVARYCEAGVDVFLGEAHFVNAEQIAVGSLLLNARRTVIATGARAAVPPISGLAAARPLTNESVFDLRSQPRRLAVLGAGPVGCELAQVFARLGTEVTVFELGPRILPAETAAAARIVATALTDRKVVLRLNASVTAVERRGRQISLTTQSGAEKFDELLVAAGRRANTDRLNLAAAGVDLDDQGLIRVDSYLKTTNPKIYAGGDACTRLQFTHHADAHARIIVQNALFLPTARASQLIVPRVTYTEPELAQVGATREELDDRKRPFDAYRVDYQDTDRGRITGDRHGFVELLVEQGGKRILGATIVGSDAGEQIAAICIAMTGGQGIDSFGRAILPYPTRAEALKRLADQYNRRRFTPRSKAWFERWFKFSI
jgi:pyruvate/2-oxoglutarate dehydrogenase complex dihydrolipoamide dehydrogenase (E3) component